MSKRGNEENYQEANKRLKQTQPAISGQSSQQASSSSNARIPRLTPSQNASNNFSNISQHQESLPRHDHSNQGYGSSSIASSSRDYDRSSYQSSSGSHQRSHYPSGGGGYHNNNRQEDRSHHNRGNGGDNRGGGGRGGFSGGYNNNRGTQSSSNTALKSNFYRIGLSKDVTFYISSYSIKCAETAEEWKALDDGEKEWILRVINYDYFRFVIFSKMKREFGWNSPIPEFPISEGSLIVSTSKIEADLIFFYMKRTKEGEFKKVPIKVEIKFLSSSSSENINDTRLKQALTICLAIFNKRLNMIRLGIADVEKEGKEIGTYKIRNGVISSLSFIKQGAYLGLSFKQKITSTRSMINTIIELQKNRYSSSDIAEKLKGLSVVYRDKSYVIRDIDFTQNPLETFTASEQLNSKLNRKGEKISFEEYYRSRYNIKIKDLKQPLISVMVKMKNQKKVQNFLIPELCYVSGIEKKDFRHIMKGLTDYKSVRDKERYVNNFVAKLNRESKETGLIIEQDALLPEFHIIKSPTINNVSMNRDKWNTTQDLAQFLIKKDEKNRIKRNWVIIGSEYLAKEFKKELKKWNIYEDSLKFEADLRMQTIEEKHRNEWEGVDFVFILFEQENKETYSNVKRFFNCEVGIPSQCIICTRDWGKRVQNCLTQIAAKLGAAIWNIASPFPLMSICACGIDIIRRGGNIKGSLTLSLNSSMTKYYSSPFEVSEPRQLTNTVLSSIKTALVPFEKRNKRCPHYLMVYYCGSDLDMHALANFIETNPRMRVCFISTNADSNTRFAINHDNPAVGTVVKSIGAVGVEEFYLNSCTIPSNFGQSKPVRYEIKCKSNDFYNPKNFQKSPTEIVEYNFNFDNVIELTFRQTHLYFNWNGSVKMPTCLLYAKKSNEAKSLTKSNPDKKLIENPYYL